MFLRNLILSCWQCLNGHRARSCQHSARPLFALKNKGRPVPYATPRSRNNPDITCFETDFENFHAKVMSDPVLKREFYHLEDTSAKRAETNPKVPEANGRGPEKRGTRSVVINFKLHEEKCSAEEIQRWKQLCGLDVGEANVGMFSLEQLVPELIMFSQPLQAWDTRYLVPSVGNMEILRGAMSPAKPTALATTFVRMPCVQDPDVFPDAPVSSDPIVPELLEMHPCNAVRNEDWTLIEQFLNPDFIPSASFEQVIRDATAPAPGEEDLWRDFSGDVPLEIQMDPLGTWVGFDTYS